MVELKHKRVTVKKAEIRPNILDSVYAIEKDKIEISSGIVGIKNRIPRQNYRRIWLMKNASNDELIQLLKYDAPVVVATAFEGLYKRRHADTYTFLKDIIEGKPKTLKFYFGMNVEEISLSEYCLIKLPQMHILDFNMSRKQHRELTNFYDRTIESLSKN